MASPLSTTGQAIQTAVNLRMIELGHNLGQSHTAALVGDIMAVINTNAATVVADAALDVVGYQPPTHRKF
jgi:hypothetical protein